MRLQLDRLFTEDVDGGMSRFVWLCRCEVGWNSADINGLLDRLEFCSASSLAPTCWTLFLRIASPVFAAKG